MTITNEMLYLREIYLYYGWKLSQLSPSMYAATVEQLEALFRLSWCVLTYPTNMGEC